VVGENRVHLVGHGRDQVAQEVAGHPRRDRLVQLDKGELARAIDGNEQVKATLLGNRLLPWRCRQRCRLERVRWGMVA
jgi:hypothetical protein